MNYKYIDCNGDCSEEENFYPFTAFEIFGAEKVTLGVFENNQPAYHCYKAAGFEELSAENDSYYELFGEKWRCIELEKVVS